MRGEAQGWWASGRRAEFPGLTALVSARWEWALIGVCAQRLCECHTEAEGKPGVFEGTNSMTGRDVLGNTFHQAVALCRVGQCMETAQYCFMSVFQLSTLLSAHPGPLTQFCTSPYWGSSLQCRRVP